MCTPLSIKFPPHKKVWCAIRQMFLRWLWNVWWVWQWLGSESRRWYHGCKWRSLEFESLSMVVWRYQGVNVWRCEGRGLEECWLKCNIREDLLKYILLHFFFYKCCLKRVFCEEVLSDFEEDITCMLISSNFSKIKFIFFWYCTLKLWFLTKMFVNLSKKIKIWTLLSGICLRKAIDNLLLKIG